MNTGGPWTAMDQNSYSAGDQQYYDQSMQDTTIEESQMTVDMDGEVPKKKIRPWEKLGPDGRAIKKKPNPAKKNAVFRKALQPKSSIMCLNELQSGLKYNTEPVATVGNFCVTVDVNGQTFRGFGTTKDLAKQAAAEAALVSYVKPPPPKSAPGQPPNIEDDTTPWRTLASFAMYKLFSDWRDGRIGTTTATGQHGFAAGMAPAGPMNPNWGMAAMQQQMQQAYPMVAQAGIVKDDPTNANVSLHLNRALNNPTVAKSPTSSTIAMPGAVDGAATAKPVSTDPKEVKLNTENQRNRHPVMILHQLVPVIKYESSDMIDQNNFNSKRFVVSAVINNHQFTGEATTIKAAKFHLAKSALKGLFEIDNIFELP